MGKQAYTGFLAAAIVALGLNIHYHFFSNLAWGVFPLLFAMLPGLILLSENRGLSLPTRLRGNTGRYLLAGIIIAAPLVCALLYAVTGGMPFLSGETGFLQFVYALLLYGTGVGLPLTALASLNSLPSPHRTETRSIAGIGAAAKNNAITLAAAAIVFFLYQSFAPTQNIKTLFGFHLLAALPLFALIFKGMYAAVPAATPSVDGSVTGKLEAGLRFAVPIAVLLVTSFWLPSLARRIMELPIEDGYMSGVILPLAALAAAGGMLLGRRLRTILPAMQDTGLLLLLAGTFTLYGLDSFNATGFSSLYLTYYAGTSSSFNVLLSTAMLFVPAMIAIGAMAGSGGASANEGTARKGSKSGRVDTSGRRGGGTSEKLSGTTSRAWVWNTLAVGMGLLLYLVLFTRIDWVTATLLQASLMLLAGILPFFVEFKLKAPQIGAAVVLFAAIYLAATLQPETYNNLYNPTAFRVSTESRMPAGRMTQLIARDYDDPYYALMWNQQLPLTQSSRSVQSTLYRMGHIPMLMAKADADVLLLGFGSGLTAEAVSMHDPASLVCVEPWEAIIALADSTKKDHKPRPWMHDITFHAERPESFLSRTDTRYDVIVSAEPFASPWPGTLTLSEAWYARVAERLEDDGVFAQWVPVALIGMDGLQNIYAGMHPSFEHTELWLAWPDAENPMACIMASKRPFTARQPDLERLALLSETPATSFHLQQIALSTPASLVSACIANEETLSAFESLGSAYGGFEKLELNRNGMELPFADAARQLFTFRSPPARLRRDLHDTLRETVSMLDSQRPVILEAQRAILAGDDSTALRRLRAIVEKTPENLEAKHVLADLLLRQAAGAVGIEEWNRAVSLLTVALSISPLNTYMLRLLMIASMQVGDKSASAMSIDGIRRLNQFHAGFRDNQATMRARQGATNDALLLYESAITLDPTNEEFYCNMASFQFSQNRVWEAIRVLDNATQRTAYPAKAWYLRGSFYAQAGRYDLALESFRGFTRCAGPSDPYWTEVLKSIDNLERALK